MADEIQRIHDVSPGGEMPPAFRVRTVVIRPVGPIGKLALAAVLVGAGALFFTVGLALAATLVVAATVAGAVMMVRGALGVRSRDAVRSPAPAPRLDPSKEIFLTKPED